MGIKKAFTLAEMMIVFIVIGVIVALGVTSVRPWEKAYKYAYTRMYHALSLSIYNHMVNAKGEEFYPTTGETVGLANTVQTTYLGHTYGSPSDETKQKGKFCSLFARKVNTTEDLTYNNGVLDVCSSNPNYSNLGKGTYTTPTFTTTDGISWYLPYTDFKSTNYNDTDGAKIYVDVNGKEGPNCINDQVTGCRPDIFIIHVMADGKMFVKGTKEKEYLGTTKLAKDRGEQ